MASSMIHTIWNTEYHRAQSWVPWALSHTLLLLEASFANMDSSFTCTLMTPRLCFLQPKIWSMSSCTSSTCTLHNRFKRLENMLKLNPTKTNLFIAGSSQGHQKLPSYVVLKINYSVIKPATTVRNTGILFDTQMSMSSHINSPISSVNYHLRYICRISEFLDQDNKHVVVRSFILSPFNYGNALLYGAKSKDLDRLQSLQLKSLNLSSLLIDLIHVVPHLL